MQVATLHLRVSMLAGLALAACSCQSAKKPVAVVPAKTAPALTSSKSPAHNPAPAPPEPKAAPQADNPKAAPAEIDAVAAPKPQAAPPAQENDAISDLVARGEKDYQAGRDAFHQGNVALAKQ